MLISDAIAQQSTRSETADSKQQQSPHTAVLSALQSDLHACLLPQAPVSLLTRRTVEARGHSTAFAVRVTVLESDPIICSNLEPLMLGTPRPDCMYTPKRYARA
eukprot:4880878-Prymnesium_polylepis.1